MPDNKNETRRNSYPNRINLGKRLEVDFWCTTFHGTEGQLCAAVANVGADATKVGAYFDARRQQGIAAVASVRRAGGVS